MRQLLFITCVVSTSWGAETTLNDLRLSVGTGIEYTQEIDLTDSLGKKSADADVFAVSLQFVHGLRPLAERGTAFIGGIIEYNRVESDISLVGPIALETQTTLLGAGAQVGYAYPISMLPQTHVECGVVGTYFVGSEDRKLTSSTQGVGLRGWGFAVRSGMYHLLDNGAQLGLELSYVIDRELHSTAESGTTSVGTTEEHQDGFILSVALGTRF